MNIILRQLRLEDAPFMLEWMNAAAQSGLLGYGFTRPRTLSDAENHIHLRLEDEFTGCEYTICDGLTGKYLGHAALTMPDEHAKTAEISLALLPSSTGQGIGTLALRELMRIGFTELGYQKLCARCLKPNIAANRLFENSGFVREGVLRRQMMLKNELADVNLYGMLIEEYSRLYL